MIRNTTLVATVLGGALLFGCAFVGPSRTFITKLIVMESTEEKWRSADSRLKESARTAGCMTGITTVTTATITITSITTTTTGTSPCAPR